MVISIKDQRYHHLALIIRAGDTPSLGFGAGQRRQQHGSENRNDRNDHQELNKGKRLSTRGVGTRRGCPFNTRMVNRARGYYLGADGDVFRDQSNCDAIMRLWKVSVWSLRAIASIE